MTSYFCSLEFTVVHGLSPSLNLTLNPNEVLRESSKDLHLDLRISSKMVINHELQWILMKKIWCHKVENSDENTENFSVGHLISLDSTMLGLINSYKFGGELGCKEGT